MGISYAARSRKYRLAYVLFGGSLAFMLGYFSYMNIEKKCHKKFESLIKESPDSDLAAKLRKMKKYSSE